MSLAPAQHPHVRGTGQHRELRAGDQPVHLYRVLEADEVVVAEDEQGRRGDAAPPGPRVSLAPARLTNGCAALPNRSGRE
jgi:hypothetical protein